MREELEIFDPFRSDLGEMCVHVCAGVSAYVKVCLSMRVSYQNL